MDATSSNSDARTSCETSAMEWVEEAPITALCVGLASGIAAGIAIGAVIARDRHSSSRRDAGSLATRLGSQFLHSMEEAARSGYQAVHSQLGGRA